MDQAVSEDQKEFYDNRWRDFRYANSLKLSRCAAILDRLYQTKLGKPHIIDLGCGSGWLTAVLGQFGPTLGVDWSGVAIDQARARYPLLDFIQANILQWDYPRSAFDVVVSQEVIEHFEDQLAYLEIAFGLLKPGGYLILTTPNKRTFQAMSDVQRSGWSNQPIENWLTQAGLRK